MKLRAIRLVKLKPPCRGLIGRRVKNSNLSETEQPADNVVAHFKRGQNSEGAIADAVASDLASVLL